MYHSLLRERVEGRAPGCRNGQEPEPERERERELRGRGEREEFIDRQQVTAEPYQFSINTDMLDVFADKFELLLSQGDTLQRIFGSSCKPIHAHLARHALHGTRHLFGCL